MISEVLAKTLPLEVLSPALLVMPDLSMTLSPLAKGLYPYLNVSALRRDNNTGLDLRIDIW